MFRVANSLKLRSLVVLSEASQFHKTTLMVPAVTTHENRKLLNVQSSQKASERRFSISSTVLHGDKKLEDFRAREEEKEAEFNKQPIVAQEEEKEEPPENDEAVTEMRNKILEASLAFVDSSGWTRQSIVKGAEQAGYPGTVHGMFPKGGIELINYFYLKGNKELIEEMREKVGDQSENVKNPQEFVCWALRQRLEKLGPYIKTWPQALAMMSLPPNVPTSLANMLTLVDDICYFSGDRSVDFNWYARRIGLATIYKATELYMLQDKSSEYENTWKFLERRIADASLVHDVLIQSEGATQHLTSAVSTAFSTARNILGLNFDRR